MQLLQYLPLTRPLAVKALSKKLDKNNVMLILDLEDSIQDPFSKIKTQKLKELARKNLYWLSNQNIKINTKNKIFIRINSLDTEDFTKDIKIIKKIIFEKNLSIDGLFLPKIEDYDQIEIVERNLKFKNKKLLYVPIIETKKGMEYLENILKKDIKKSLIFAIHYGHFDYCLDTKSWPFPDPFHNEFWEIITYIVNLSIKYNKIYIHTPFPFLKNVNIFWGSEAHLKSKFRNLKFFLTSINIDISLSKKPLNLKKFKLKNMSNSKEYHINFANKIIKIFKYNRVNKRSFAISDKRFIPPHQYFMANYFLNSNKK